MAKETDPYLMSRQELIARVIELEGILFDIEENDDPSIDANAAILQVALGITTQQAQIVLCLIDGRVKSRQFIQESVGFSQLNQLDVVLCQMRPRLALHGVKIDTIWRTGLRLGDGITLVRNFLKHPELIAA